MNAYDEGRCARALFERNELYGRDSYPDCYTPGEIGSYQSGWDIQDQWMARCALFAELPFVSVSGNISRAYYSASTEELRVSFMTAGVTYDYAGVPQAVVDEFGIAIDDEDSLSGWRFFLQHIKGKYEAAKVCPPDAIPVW